MLLCPGRKSTTTTTTTTTGVRIFLNPDYSTLIIVGLEYNIKKYPNFTLQVLLGFLLDHFKEKKITHKNINNIGDKMDK